MIKGRKYRTIKASEGAPEATHAFLRLSKGKNPAELTTQELADIEAILLTGGFTQEDIDAVKAFLV